MDQVKLSIWMIVYNHENYLREALDSVFMQQVNFDFEVIIGDDCSSDNSRDIILEYQAKYPEIIFPLIHTENVGVHKNVVLTLRACKGQYIALLEGDDYWTDPNKLQRQVDFLEKNQAFVMSSHNTHDLNEIDPSASRDTSVWPGDTILLENILEAGWFMRTNSLVFRNNLIAEYPEWFFTHYSTDYMLQILIAKHGPVNFMQEVMAVYRRHEAGISNTNIEKQIGRYWNVVDLLQVMDHYFEGKYHRFLQIQKAMYFEAIFVARLKQRKMRNMKELFEIIPQINWKKLITTRLFARFQLKTKIS